MKGSGGFYLDGYHLGYLVVELPCDQIVKICDVIFSKTFALPVYLLHQRSTIMKTTKYISALIIIFGLAFSSTLESCSIQSDSTAVASKSEKSALLSAGGWVLLSATKDLGSPQGELDIYFMLSESERSDVLYFQPNHNAVKTSLQFKSGRVENSPMMKGKWKLIENESTLVMTVGSKLTQLTIEKLTASVLIVSTTEYDAFFDKDVKSTFGYRS
jgi:hypothetical protein